MQKEWAQRGNIGGQRGSQMGFVRFSDLLLRIGVAVDQVAIRHHELAALDRLLHPRLSRYASQRNGFRRQQ